MSTQKEAMASAAKPMREAETFVAESDLAEYDWTGDETGHAPSSGARTRPFICACRRASSTR